MNVTIKMPHKLSPLFDNASQKIRRELFQGLVEGLMLVQKRATQNITSKFRVKTGMGMRSVKVEIGKSRGRKLSGWAGIPGGRADGFYMRFHETGVVSKPRKRDYLMIPQPDGTFRRVKRAVIPKRPWLAPAAERSEKEIRRIIETKVTRLLK